MAFGMARSLAARDGFNGKLDRRWYYITDVVCPVCGRGKTHRDPRPLPRPEAWEDRHETIESACGSHFV